MSKPGNALALLVTIWLCAGCSWLASGPVTESATVVYSAGSKKHTAAVQVPIPAQDVYTTFVRIIRAHPEVDFENRNDKAMLIEVAQGSRSLTGQVTKLGDKSSLLYVWVDAGESGMTGRQLAISVVEIVCDELGVEYELVNY